MTAQIEATHAARAAARFDALMDAAERTNEALMNALRAEVAAMIATMPNAPLSAREVGGGLVAGGEAGEYAGECVATPGPRRS